MLFADLHQYLSTIFKTAIKFFVIAFCVRFFVVDIARVNGVSMESTLHDDQTLYINKAEYFFTQPKRYDIVQIYSSKKGEFFVKRIIGLPGEHLVFRADGIYVSKDGSTQKIDEPFLSVERTLLRPGEQSVVDVPASSYYVLGDNRPQSIDSRDFGSVHRRYIQGKIIQ